MRLATLALLVVVCAGCSLFPLIRVDSLALAKWAQEPLSPQSAGDNCDQPVGFAFPGRWEREPGKTVCVMEGPMRDELNQQMLVRQQFKNLKTKVTDTTFCEGLPLNPQLHSPCYMSGVRICSLSGKNQLTVCSVWNAGVGDYSRTGDNGCMACPGTIHYSKGPI